MSSPPRWSPPRSKWAGPIFFSLAIIILSFVPVFMLEAQEGRMFRPLAYTKTFAMASATVLSITFVPALMTLFLRGRRLKPEAANPFYRLSIAIYEPVLRAALRWRWTTLLVNMAVVPLTIPLIFLLGSEFMPPLYEGTLLYMPTVPARRVHHRKHTAAAGAGQSDQGVPRGGARLRHYRPRHDADGQLADGHGEHDHRAEAEARVARWE